MEEEGKMPMLLFHHETPQTLQSQGHYPGNYSGLFTDYPPQSFHAPYLKLNYLSYPQNPSKPPSMPSQAFRKVISNDGRTYFECTANDCDKRFTRRADNARAHWYLHCRVEPYKCNACSKGFRRQTDLKRHFCPTETQSKPLP
jgi:hypothetical protein